jgi:Pectate lyase superfamily protein
MLNNNSEVKKMVSHNNSSIKVIIVVLLLIVQVVVFAATEQTVTSITAMENLTGLVANDRVNVSSGSGVDGQFRFVSGSSSAIDNALVFSANGGRWERVYSGALNVKWFGAAGNGSTDDTTAIQDCIDAASEKQCGIMLPKGNYKITFPLDIKSNVNMTGMGRNFGTVISPSNCYAFKIDGSDKSGGWVFRIRISDMLIKGDLTSDTYGSSLIKMKNAYNIELARIWVYNQATTNGLEVSGCNAITIEDCIFYGQSTGTPRAVYIHDGDGKATVRLVRPDIEVYNRGIKVSGEVITTINAPYSERCIVNIEHSASGNGATSIKGGSLTAINGYCLIINSNNFSLGGTVLKSYNATTLNKVAVYVPASTLCNNVKIEPANDYSGAINDTYLNYAAADVVKNISGMKSGKIEFKKTVNDNVLTDLFSISNGDTVKVKLTVCAAVAYAQAIKTFEFMINSSIITASPIETTVLNESNGNYSIVLTPTVSYSGGVATVKVTSDQGGGLLSGESATVFGTLEYTVIDSGTCVIKRL